MGRKILGAVLLLVIIVAGALAWKFAAPRIEEKRQVATSDATRTLGKVRLALDGWVGYFPLRSPEMKRLLRAQGLNLEISDDHGAYRERMKRLSDGEYDLAVMTVDSDVLTGAAHNYPGVIIAVIDQSKGGDAILGRSAKVSSLDDVRKDATLRVAFTPDSPSHHLAKAAAAHFSLPGLLPPAGDPRRLETEGSEEACRKLAAGEADIAVCWEPDISKTLGRQGIVKLIGTESIDKLVVDVLLVSRDFMKSRPAMVEQVLSSYFQSLKHYRETPEELGSEVATESGLPPEDAKRMLSGVKWVGLSENCEQWFGIGPSGSRVATGILDSIESAVRVLLAAGDFKESPLPGRDAARLVFGSFLEKLYSQGFTNAGNGAVAVDSIAMRFSPLDAEGWAKQKTVGALKVDPIMFSRGRSDLTLPAKETIDTAVERLKHYPDFRVAIEGHTSTQGDPEANLALSQERAEAVARYLTVAYNLDPNRLRVVGLGGGRPLPRLSDETPQAHAYRLARVEFILTRSDY